MLCDEPVTGREHVLLGPVEEEDDVVLEGLWGLHEHLQHLQHDCTGDRIVACSWVIMFKTFRWSKKVARTFLNIFVVEPLSVRIGRIRI